jgi:RHS repeat-associated protein
VTDCVPAENGVVDATEYHFTGKERDTESGNDYFGASYYSSAMGRFSSPDPSGLEYADPKNPQSLNLYSYVLNNPLHYVDPTGMYCDYSDHNDPSSGFDDSQFDYNSNSGECRTGRLRGKQKHPGFLALHVAVDDHSRLAFTQMLPDQKAHTTIGFLHAAVRFFARHGITVRALLTDNGSSYRSHHFRLACQRMKLKHRRTRPYTPAHRRAG